MKCPTCGTENEATNRFCDQCGSRIEPSEAGAQAQTPGASQPAATPTCPSCGAAVLPGEAFCDECGASLSGVAVASAGLSPDAPTMFAPPRPDGGATSAGDQASLCPACGHQNLPGDDFCDNCGAALGAAAADSTTVVAPQTAPSDEELLRSLNAAPPTVPEPQSPPAEPAPPAEAPPAEPAQPAEAPPAEPAQPVEAPPAAPAPELVAAADQPTIEQTALPSQAEYQAERQRLEAEIERQQQIITQLEQMVTMFGAAVPPAVTQGLSEARSAQARTQAELDALQPPLPPIDPAEVARLNEEIARQQQIITQFEQMQAMFGAATPPAVAQGLADARAAKARTEAELAALGGGAAPTATPAASPEAAPAPSTPVAEAPPAPAPSPALSTAVTESPPAPPPAAPAVAPAPVASGVAPMAAPHLLIEENGTELPLPTDKREIIIGREDPISGIFPEIDLTPYGGESGGVSRQHARINHDADQWTLTDLNSTNYTRVDGTKIDPSVPVPIKDGARLQFGRVAVMFRA